jgi:hypothetical protein
MFGNKQYTYFLGGITMIMLTNQNFKNAGAFIKENGRYLEKALFGYYFEKGTIEDVLKELSKYQNEDGGFGHALECDVRLTSSNQLATSLAFQLFSELNISDDNEIVTRAIDYVVLNYKAEFKGWLMLPPEVEEVPRAIWWNYDSNKDNMYNCNPSAEIAGYLSRYKKLAPQNIVNESVNAAIDHLNENYDNFNMHDILCYQRMSKEVSNEQKELILSKLRKRLRNATNFNTEKWIGYEARPLSYIHDPSDELANEFSKDELAINLDYVINEQQENGSWTPTWNWCRFEEEWKLAEKEWMGVITLNNLKILKAFNRITL